MIADNIPNPCPLTLIADSTGKRTVDVRNIAKRLGCNVRGKEKFATVGKSDALRIINEIQAKKEKNIAKQLQNIQTEAISQPTNHKENVMQIGFLTLADIAKANNITNERAKEILDAENIKPALYPDEDTPVPLYKDKVCGRVERFLIAEAAAEEERKRLEAEKAAEEERKRIEEERARKAEELKEKSLSEEAKEVSKDAQECADLIQAATPMMQVCANNFQTMLDNGQQGEVYKKLLTNFGYMTMLVKASEGKVKDVGIFKSVPLWLANAAQQRDSAVVAQVLAANEVTRELMIVNNLLRDLLNATKENLEQTRRLADAFGTPENDKK